VYTVRRICIYDIGTPRVQVGGLLECGVFQCVAVCCSVAMHSFVYTVRRIRNYYSGTSRVHLGVSWSAACCGVLQCVAVCCSVLQCHNTFIRIQ